MKACGTCGIEIATKDGVNHCSKCEDASPKQKQRARKRRSEMDSLMRDLGLTKVRGSMGGTYYE